MASAENLTNSSFKWQFRNTCNLFFQGKKCHIPTQYIHIYRKSKSNKMLMTAEPR